MTSSTSQVITEYGKQNIFGRETQPQLVEDYTSYPEEAEKTNGRWAMIGFFSLLVSYFTLVKSFQEFSKKTLLTMQPSNKTILERSLGRPAMMAFVLLTGVYLTTGQLIPGIV
tara:strand:- start:167 stop:505 length:339 start_codon:yes stop_codon:yes gene_type:complete